VSERARNNKLELYSGYRRWCLPWWREHFSPHTYWRWLKWHWQRARRGYSDIDWIGFDTYMATVCIDVLERFKDGSGHPAYDDVETFDDWRIKLDEMIAGFKAALAIQDFEGYEPKEMSYDEWYKPLEEKRQRGFATFSKWFLALWD